MTWYTHVNRNVIDSNRKHGRELPPIKIQKGLYGKSSYGFRVALPAGSVMRYDPRGILPCGARLVIESNEEPVIEQVT